MGISHSVILSGLLGATECEFFVVERSKVAQVLARSLLKQCMILPESKVKEFQFDFALICTPPFVEVGTRMLANTKKFIAKSQMFPNDKLFQGKNYN